MIPADRIKVRKVSSHSADDGHPVPSPDFRALFESAPDPCLVLDRELRVVAVNDAYLRTTMTTRENILGLNLFVIFPDNPDHRYADGVRNLGESLNRVLHNLAPDSMAVQRYDIRKPEAEGGGFEERHWSSINTPVFGVDGGLAYIIHRVQDVTEFVLHHRERGDDQKLTDERRAELESEIYARSREVAETNLELHHTVSELKESRQLFDAFMSHLPAAAWMRDMQGRYVFANQQMERMFATPKSALLGKTAEEVFPPEIAHQFFEIDRRVLEEGESVQPIEIVPRGSEDERYLMVSKFTVRGSDGLPLYIAGVAIDATEYKRMELEIEKLASFQLLNPNPVIELDRSGKLTFCNPAAKAILLAAGLTEEANPFIPEDLPFILHQLLDGKTPYFFREVAVGERTFEELIALTPQSDTVRCYTMDISKRRRAEHEREQLLLQLEAVLQSINEGVVISDLSGNILTMNREALALHECASVEEVRRHASELQERFELSDQQGEIIPLDQWPVMRALRGERFFDYQVRFRNKKTGRVWIGNYSGTPVHDREGNPILAVITLRDITSRKSMEEQIVKLNVDLAARVSELEAFNQELEAFNRMVSHDLRQPLNTIGTSCQAVQMLCGDQLGEDCSRYIRIAYDKVLSMNELIASLLKFSRSTHSELKKERVDLSALARNVIDEVRLADPGRRVRFQVQEGIAANGDPNLLRSVLENLIGNAWKFTGKAEEAVIEFGATDMNGTETYFVRDNGSGFEMPDIEHLFTPFKRMPGAEQVQGFGIGLATVDRIVRRHGGRVCAEGAPGKGATFYFTLSAAEP